MPTQTEIYVILTVTILYTLFVAIGLWVSKKKK